MQVLAIWGLFAGLVVGTLMVDILRYMNKPQPLALREAAAWTGTWIGLAALFGVAVFAFNGMDKGMEFVTGYVTEWSVSAGILVVFLMIFRYFRVPSDARARVLFWGIVGAIVLRGMVLFGGASQIPSSPGLDYIFGAFLIYTGMKLLRQGPVPAEPRKDPVPGFSRRNGKRVATALVPVMIAIAATDTIFSAYSIPAILAITQDPFIVYTANLYAILGLRALFHLLAGLVGLFRYLQAGLCTALMFVGVRMLISGFVHVPVAISVGAVAIVLSGSIVASMIFPEPKSVMPEGGKETPAESTGSAGKESEEDKEKYRRAA